MSCSPQELFEAAKEMASDAREVSCRNAISRAYYSAYHGALKAFPEQQQAAITSASNWGIHKRFFEQLNQSAPGSDERRLGIKLHTMHKRRIVADYDLGATVRSTDVAQQIDGARRVFELCQNSDAPPCISSAG